MYKASRAAYAFQHGHGEVAMQSEAVLQRHLLVWRDPPVWPLWRGLVPILALLLLAAFALGPAARSWVQGTVRRELREQLSAGGYAWVNLAVSGQSVTLSGTAPTGAAGERAMALARAATCPTWIGGRSCATRVTGTFTLAPSPAPAVPEAAPLPAPPAAQACERSLARALAGEEIRFARDSATIGARSGPLLDQLAQQIRACPGNIRIEGYTDGAGRPAANRA
ncbi:MAG: hypothetical protein ACREQ5_24720, partial [Candidatus Dormibacteria bacterium]